MTLPSNLRGILSMLLAMGVLIGSDSCMKLGLADVPLLQLMAMRGSAGVLQFLPLWAVLAGAILFNDFPNGLAIAGMGLVTIAGLLIIYLDGRQRRLDVGVGLNPATTRAASGP